MQRVFTDAQRSSEAHRVALLKISGMVAKEVLPQRCVHKLQDIQQSDVAFAAFLPEGQDLKEPEPNTKACVLQPAPTTVHRSHQLPQSSAASECAIVGWWNTAYTQEYFSARQG